MKSDTRDKLEARLKYYREIGIPAFYRDRVAEGLSSEQDEAAGAGLEPPPSSRSSKSAPAQAAPPRTTPPVTALPVIQQAPGLFDSVGAVPDDTLDRVREDIGDCTRCKLHRKRNTIVFGVGDPRAELVFVGEGPGADEDAQGIPFVGRAGKLLTQMIEAMGLKREQVYICNVVKCRPPENRTPDNEEIATCSPFLFRQLDVIRPKVIVCLGSVAVKTMLRTNLSMGRLRGQWFQYKASKLLATYHPAYCLRNPPSKADVWKDLQLVMSELGLPLPPKKK